MFISAIQTFVETGILAGGGVVVPLKFVYIWNLYIYDNYSFFDFYINNFKVNIKL